MPNGTYGGVRGRKTKVGRKLLRFPPTRFFLLLRSVLLVWSLIELSGYQHNSVVLDTFLIAPFFGLEVTLHGEHCSLGELVE